MKISPLAGKPVESSMLINVPKLVSAYYTNTPDPSVSEQRIAFGTSGHRGSSLKSSSGDPAIFQQSRGARIH
ncbi:MAG: hypothetical protein ABL861_03375 [Nitrosomonas sp.]